MNPTATEYQVRDAALAMCVVLSGQEPADYGFTLLVPIKDEKQRYEPYTYRFDAGDGKTADDKRTAAFKKWAEWEKTNPDKLKAKPPETKGK